jgi:hypothetical protein
MSSARIHAATIEPLTGWELPFTDARLNQALHHWVTEFVRADNERIEADLRSAILLMDPRDVHALQVVIADYTVSWVDGDFRCSVPPRAVACAWPQPEPLRGAEQRQWLARVFEAVIDDEGRYRL